MAEAHWAAINATTSGDTTVVSAVSGKKIRVTELTLLVSAAAAVAWKSGSTTLIEAMAWPANGGINYEGRGQGPEGYFLETVAGEALVINLSTNANVRGRLAYVLV